MFHDLEWVALRVKGQSVMLHQIRKMVGMAIAILRTGADPVQSVALSTGKAKRNVPRAPGVGLYLRQINFDSYNKRLARLHNPQDSLDWNKYRVRSAARAWRAAGGGGRSLCGPE